MNEIELRQLPLLFKNYLKKHRCSDYYIMSAHTSSRFDLIFKSGDTSIVGEYKFRTNNIQDFFNTVIEESKYKALIAASKIIGAVPFYIVESDNIILMFDLTNRNLKWYESSFRKNNQTSEIITKSVSDLDVLSADFILVKKDYGYYRIPKSMMKDMYLLKEIEKHERTDAYQLKKDITARVRDNFRKIQLAQ